MTPQPAPRILLVDDNPALVESLTEVLTGSGYAVTAQGTCEAALETAREGFDVALVDLHLPDGDGTALAPRLKDLVPDGQVVLLTGFATLESAAAAVRAGACAYLVKPCATHELLLTVEQALRQVRLHAEKRELSRRAQVAEKLASVGTLTAGLSHESATPSTPRRSSSRSSSGASAGCRKRSSRGCSSRSGWCATSIRRLDHVLEDFLQFARPRDFLPHPVDVPAALRKVLDLLESDAERRHIALARDLAPVPAVRGEEGRIRQVVMNLALNALHAAGHGGTVRMACHLEPDGREVAIEVDDSGPGIPSEVRTRLFEPFFTTKAEGSGLGLAIVHAIVVQHGGSVAVGDAPGGGARFTVRLPAA